MFRVFLCLYLVMLKIRTIQTKYLRQTIFRRQNSFRLSGFARLWRAGIKKEESQCKIIVNSTLLILGRRRGSRGFACKLQSYMFLSNQPWLIIDLKHH